VAGAQGHHEAANEGELQGSGHRISRVKKNNQPFDYSALCALLWHQRIVSLLFGPPQGWILTIMGRALHFLVGR